MPDGAAAQVKLGRYQCRTVGSAEAELRADLEVQASGAYAVGGAAGEYSFEPATRLIEWRTGPFTADPDWVGRYIPQGEEGYATTSVEVWNRSDLEAGYRNPLQRCQHTAEQSVAPTSAPAATHEVRYEVPGTGTAHLSFKTPSGMQVLQSEALPWSLTVSLDEGTLASLRSEGTENGQLVGCRILIDGAVAVDSQPAPYGLCEWRVPGG